MRFAPTATPVANYYSALRDYWVSLYALDQRRWDGSRAMRRLGPLRLRHRSVVLAAAGCGADGAKSATRAAGFPGRTSVLPEGARGIATRARATYRASRLSRHCGPDPARSHACGAGPMHPERAPALGRGAAGGLRAAGAGFSRRSRAPTWRRRGRPTGRRRPTPSQAAGARAFARAVRAPRDCPAGLPAGAGRCAERRRDASPSARARLELLGADADSFCRAALGAGTAFRVITDLGAAPGEFAKSLDNSNPLCTIADLSSVWAVGDVYEKDSRQPQGRRLRRRSPSARIPPSPGTAGSRAIGSALDTTTRTLKVRVVLVNPGTRLKPDMFAVDSCGCAPSGHRSWCRIAAVLREGDRRHTSTYQTSPGHFARRAVTLGRDTERHELEVISGLAPGDTIVVEGAELLRATLKAFVQLLLRYRALMLVATRGVAGGRYLRLRCGST